VHDPAGLAVFGSSVFVGNRFGNQGGQGSIQKFNFDGTGLVFDQDITGNGLQRVHGVGVNAASGEVVGVNIFGGGLSRFLPSGSGFTANGAFTSGEARDIVSSADGTKWYVSELSNTIRVIDLVANTQTTFAIAGANQIHQMAWRNGSLYVTGFSSDTVHKVDLDGSGMVTGSSIVLSVNNAIGMAFSPDGQEMFVSEHDGNRIFRFLESGGSWVANGTILTGKSMGYLAAVPEPGTMILVGLGLATVARRRLR
jgi:DNA-binding beta-propeller fold protein YncE